MEPVARVGDETSCPAFEYVILPHLGGPLINASPVCLAADGRSIIRVGDYGECKLAAPLDVVVEGAATFTVCGLPVARKGDGMVHGGHIVEGSPTLVVGGPTFKIPPNMRIKGPASYQNLVIRDLYFLSTTPTGKTILDGIESSGQDVDIIPCPDPHNSFATPNDGPNSSNGKGTGSVVQYNPSAAFSVQDINGNWIGEPPQVLFAHELVHAYHNAHGTNVERDPDPHGPASEADIPKEEGQTIGTGTWDGTAPTENSLRAELGLGRRDNWYGNNYDASGAELTAPTAQLRPGDC